MMLCFFTLVDFHIAVGIQIDTCRDFLFVILSLGLFLDTKGIGKLSPECLTGLQSLFLDFLSRECCMV